MRAVAVNPKERSIGVIEHPEPVLEGPTAVKLRMLEIGVCGTDRELARFSYGAPPDGDQYLVIGHESLGEVAEVGDEVNGFAVGDLAVPRVRRPCPHAGCLPCRAGEPDFCYTGDYTERGIKGAHGYLAEYAVVDASYLHRVPAALREVAVLTEPLTIAEKAMDQVTQIQRRLPGFCRHGEEVVPQTHRAVVIGAGPVGILGAMVLLVSGYDTYVYSREPGEGDRAELVRALGAAYLAAQEHPVERLPQVVGRIDLVYEAAGAASVAYDVLGVLGTNGIFVFTGVPGRKAPVTINAGALMRNQVLKNQVVLGTVNAGREDFERAIRHLGEFRQRWPDALGRVIAGRHPMEVAARVLTERLPGVKQVITVGKAGG